MQQGLRWQQGARMLNARSHCYHGACDKPKSPSLNTAPVFPTLVSISQTSHTAQQVKALAASLLTFIWLWESLYPTGRKRDPHKLCSALHLWTNSHTNTINSVKKIESISSYSWGPALPLVEYTFHAKQEKVYFKPLGSGRSITLKLSWLTKEQSKKDSVIYFSDSGTSQEGNTVWTRFLLFCPNYTRTHYVAPGYLWTSSPPGTVLGITGASYHSWQIYQFLLADFVSKYYKFSCNIGNSPHTPYITHKSILMGLEKWLSG